MGPTDFPPGLNDPKGALSRVWSEISSNASSTGLISLRDAANVVGFRMFPVGWTWEEYLCPLQTMPRNYEAGAAKTALFGFPHPQTGAHAELTSASATYRRHQAEQTLLKVLRTGRVPVVVSEWDCRRRELARVVLYDDTFKLDVDRSSVRYQNESEHADLYSNEFFIYLASDKNFLSRKSKHDWLLIERFLRSYILATGFTESNDRIIDHCRDWRRHHGAPAEFDQSGARDLMMRLRREYLPSDE